MEKQPTVSEGAKKFLKAKAFNEKALKLLEVIRQKDQGALLNHDNVAGFERIIALTKKGIIRIHNDSNSIIIEKDIEGKIEKTRFPSSDEEGALAKIQEIVNSFQ